MLNPDFPLPARPPRGKGPRTKRQRNRRLARIEADRQREIDERLARIAERKEARRVPR